MADQELLIKKYGNRRLYDTESSRYITLEDLSRILKSGRDIRVVDAKEGKDITKSVLLQIIAEGEKEHDLLPLSFLKKVIQLSDHALAESLHRYLRVSLDAFLNAQKELDQQYRTFAGSLLNPLGSLSPAAKPNPLLWPLAWMQRAAAGEQGAAPEESEPPAAAAGFPPGEAPPEPPPSEPEPDSTGSQLDALKVQMEQMQQLLAELQRKK